MSDCKLIDAIRGLDIPAPRKAALALIIHAQSRCLAAVIRLLTLRALAMSTAATSLKYKVFAAPGRLRVLFLKLQSKRSQEHDGDRAESEGYDMPDPKAMTKSEAAVAEAGDYLRSCGIQLPRFKLSPATGRLLGGSHTETDRPYRVCIGRFLTPFIRRWFAMHELGHLLWAEHRPLRNKGFRRHFGEPLPEDYDSQHVKHAWKTVCVGPLSRFPGLHRPRGQPAWYGALAGGEERFCELIALMYANCGGFDGRPPADLEGLWDCCWKHGLSRMT